MKTKYAGENEENPYFHPGQLCEFQQDEKSWMKNEPGLLGANSVCILSDVSFLSPSDVQPPQDF